MKNKRLLIYHERNNYLGLFTGNDYLGDLEIFDLYKTFPSYGAKVLHLFGWEVITEL